MSPALESTQAPKLQIVANHKVQSRECFLKARLGCSTSDAGPEIRSAYITWSSIAATPAVPSSLRLVLTTVALPSPPHLLPTYFYFEYFGAGLKSLKSRTVSPWSPAFSAPAGDFETVDPALLIKSLEAPGPGHPNLGDLRFTLRLLFNDTSSQHPSRICQTNPPRSLVCPWIVHTVSTASYLRTTTPERQPTYKPLHHGWHTEL